MTVVRTYSAATKLSEHKKKRKAELLAFSAGARYPFIGRAKSVLPLTLQQGCYGGKKAGRCHFFDFFTMRRFRHSITTWKSPHDFCRIRTCDYYRIISSVEAHRKYYREFREQEPPGIRFGTSPRTAVNKTQAKATLQIYYIGKIFLYHGKKAANSFADA